MKKGIYILSVAVILLAIIPLETAGQESDSDSHFNVSCDFYSNYVWRGTRLGSGPQVQPTVEYTAGGFTAGLWGSFDVNGYSEADPYLSYSFPFGLSLGITDYYYPDMPLFDFSRSSGSHALELNAGFVIKGLSVEADYIINEAGGAASAGGDIYFQAGYSFKDFCLWAGAGNGWHTSDGEFALCNVGLGTTRTIEVTEKFSIPVSGQIIFNPERERLYMVIGFSF